MGLRPMAASLLLESGFNLASRLGQESCKIISEKSGFSNSDVAKRLEETSKYISTYIPEDARKFLFGMAMIYAVNHVQYSDYTTGYLRSPSQI